MGRSLVGASVGNGVFSSTHGDSMRAAGGFLGRLGLGQYRPFLSPGTHSFTVPEGVSRIRVRVVGAGGGGGGSGTSGQAGGTSSFGSLLSATGGNGGKSGNQSGTSLGGVGVGGDFQAKGGTAYKDGTSRPENKNDGCQGRGGAGAGSQLGDGGHSYGYGGAGVGGNQSVSSSDYGSSAYGIANSEAGGPDCVGRSMGYMRGDFQLPTSNYSTERFPFDCFNGAGGFSYLPVGENSIFATSGGSGAGGAYNTTRRAGSGGHGGGGGASSSSSSGDGGIGGGGGGEQNGGGGAGGGYAHGEFNVSPGDSYAVIVGFGGTGYNAYGGSGLVVVEW